MKSLTSKVNLRLVYLAVVSCTVVGLVVVNLAFNLGLFDRLKRPFLAEVFALTTGGNVYIIPPDQPPAEGGCGGGCCAFDDECRKKVNEKCGEPGSREWFKCLSDAQECDPNKPGDCAESPLECVFFPEAEGCDDPGVLDKVNHIIETVEYYIDRAQGKVEPTFDSLAGRFFSQEDAFFKVDYTKLPYGNNPPAGSLSGGWYNYYQLATYHIPYDAVTEIDKRTGTNPNTFTPENETKYLIWNAILYFGRLVDEL